MTLITIDLEFTIIMIFVPIVVGLYSWIITRNHYMKNPYIILSKYIEWYLMDIDSDIQSKNRRMFVKELKRMFEDYEIKWE